MPVIGDTTLSEAELRVLDRFVAGAREALGDRLLAVWLYGSRARGEERRPDSDVDLVILSEGGRSDRPAMARVASEAMGSERGESVLLSLHTEAPSWLDERRAIQDFFVADLDRDRVVVYERGA